MALSEETGESHEFIDRGKRSVGARRRCSPERHMLGTPPDDQACCYEPMEWWLPRIGGGPYAIPSLHYFFMTETQDPQMPVWQELDIPSKWDIVPIHNSDRGSFKNCRRKWDWSSPARRNLTVRADIHGINIPMWFGTGIHYALEQYYSPLIKRDPVEAFKTWFDVQWHGGVVTEEWLPRVYDLNPQSTPDGSMWTVRGLDDVLPDPDQYEFESLMELGVQMLTFYKRYAQVNDAFEVIVAEHDFSVPIWDYENECILRAVDAREDSPNYGKILEVHARGRLDAITAKPSGKLGIMDYKTAAKVGDDYFRKLENDEQCVPLNTQALTKTGWKYRNELSVGDEILAFDPIRQVSEWTPILRLNDYENKEILRLENKQGTFSVRCTAKHRWIGRRCVGAGRSDEHWNSWEVETDGLPISHGKIRVACGAILPDDCSLSIDEAAVIGWILTDGSIGHYESGLSVTISQAEHKYASEIQETIDRASISAGVATISRNKLSDRPTKTWRFSNKEIRNLFGKANLSLTKNQDFTEFVLNLDFEALEAFAEAGLKAEGSRNGGTVLNHFSQNDGEVKDAFRLAFYLLGYYITPGTSKGFGLKVDQEVDARTLRTSPDGIEDVWCPTTKHGTWVMKQDNVITITGNCTTYLWAGQIEAKYYNLPHSGEPLEEVLYNVMRKAYPKPPTIVRGGLFSVDRANESTTYEMLMEWIEATQTDIEQLSEKHQNYIEYVREVGNEQFIIRKSVRRNQHELANAGRRIYLEALDMLSPDIRVYPNITNDFGCLNCAFRAPCLAQESGADYEQLLDDNYTTSKDR